MKVLDLGWTIMLIEIYAKSLPSSLLARLGSWSWSLLLVLVRHQWHWSAVTITHPASGLADWPQTPASHWLPVSTLTSDWFPLTGHLTSGPWTEAVCDTVVARYIWKKSKSSGVRFLWLEGREESFCLKFFFFFPSLVARVTSGQWSCGAECGVWRPGFPRNVKWGTDPGSLHHLATWWHQQLGIVMMLMTGALVTAMPPHTGHWRVSSSGRSLASVSGYQPRPLEHFTCVHFSWHKAQHCMTSCASGILYEDQGQSVTNDHSGHQCGKLLLLKVGRERERREADPLLDFAISRLSAPVSSDSWPVSVAPSPSATVCPSSATGATIWPWTSALHPGSV